LIDGVVNRVLALEIKVVDAILPVHVGSVRNFVCEASHHTVGLMNRPS
jgi:hypothetical protein